MSRDFLRVRTVLRELGDDKRRLRCTMQRQDIAMQLCRVALGRSTNIFCLESQEKLRRLM
ncbi:MAG: hypothetical protein ACYCXI_06735 [Dethiobacteraceae bacterium]